MLPKSCFIVASVATHFVSLFIFHDGYKFNTPQSIGAYNNTVPEWKKKLLKPRKRLKEEN
jgi:hypothetical protein